MSTSPDNGDFSSTDWEFDGGEGNDPDFSEPDIDFGPSTAEGYDIEYPATEFEGNENGTEWTHNREESDWPADPIQTTGDGNDCYDYDSWVNESDEVKPKKSLWDIFKELF